MGANLRKTLGWAVGINQISGGFVSLNPSDFTALIIQIIRRLGPQRLYLNGADYGCG
jgi:hypothetical protein